MKQTISKEVKESWHEDPKNWILGFLYFNRSDRRVIVPKRNPFMGWTINFARSYSYLILALIAALIFVLTRIRH
jgi:uncharacterized membrane protein